MRQILLITDGCSNVGVSPVVAAAHAHAANIAVNVIGVVDQGETGFQGSREIEEIARAGGGMSRIVNAGQLSRTVQMMTRKTVTQTIQQAVHKELHQVLGEPSIEALPPSKRAQVVQVIDQLSETASLRVALLIDASASMKPKLQAVEESIHDLMLSLQAREGHSEIAVFHYPASGRNQEEVATDLNWTGDVSRIGRLFQKISMRGSTPTGPAILHTIQMICEDDDRMPPSEKGRRVSG